MHRKFLSEFQRKGNGINLEPYQAWLAAVPGVDLSGDVLTMARAVLHDMVSGKPTVVESVKARGKATGTGTKRAAKAYSATVYEASGVVAVDLVRSAEGRVVGEKDLQSSHDNGSTAARWVDRKLADGAPGWYGEVVCHLTKITYRVDRDAAIGRVYGKRAPGPICKSGATSGFSGKMRARETKVTHSRG